MGIKGLNKFLNKNIPDIYEEISLREYAYKKIAIDTNIYIFKYKSINNRMWIISFINLIGILRKNNVHCFFVFDKGCPIEKMEERNKRKEEREKYESRIFELEKSLEYYHENNEINDILRNYIDKNIDKIKTPLYDNNDKSIPDMSMVKYSIQNMKDRIVNITKEDFLLVKELLDILNIPYCDAIEEAENACSKYCLEGKVSAVLSEDSDVLAYNCPVFLSKINIGKETCVRICYENILEELEITREQFLDFCIMCGTDYNKNIYKIGPEKSFKLIDQHKNIENVGENTGNDISILNHIRSREIFNNPKGLDIDIKFCGRLDVIKMEDFINKNRLNLSMDYINSMFDNQDIVIND